MSDFADRLPRTAQMFTMTIAHINSALNPILYGIFNPAFQKGYKKIFRLIIHHKSYQANYLANEAKEKTVQISTLTTKTRI